MPHTLANHGGHGLAPDYLNLLQHGLTVVRNFATLTITLGDDGKTHSIKTRGGRGAVNGRCGGGDIPIHRLR